MRLQRVTIAITGARSALPSLRIVSWLTDPSTADARPHAAPSIRLEVAAGVASPPAAWNNKGGWLGEQVRWKGECQPVDRPLHVCVSLCRAAHAKAVLARRQMPLPGPHGLAPLTAGLAQALRTGSDLVKRHAECSMRHVACCLTLQLPSATSPNEDDARQADQAPEAATHTERLLEHQARQDRCERRANEAWGEGRKKGLGARCGPLADVQATMAVGRARHFRATKAASQPLVRADHAGQVAVRLGSPTP